MSGFGYFSHTHCWQVYKIKHTAMQSPETNISRRMGRTEELSDFQCGIVIGCQVRSSQAWEHAPDQRVAASTFRRNSRSLRLAIHQADAWPIPISLRCWSTCCNHETRGRPIGLLHSGGSLADRIWWAGSASGKWATCPHSRSWRSRTMQVTNLILVSLQPLVGHKVRPAIAKDSPKSRSTKRIKSPP